MYKKCLNISSILSIHALVNAAGEIYITMPLLTEEDIDGGVRRR